MAINLGDAILYCGADFGGMQKAISSAMGGLNKSFNEMTKTTKSGMDGILAHGKAIGLAMSGVGTGIMGALSFAVKGSVDFQKGLAEVQTLGVKNMDRLREAIEEVSMNYAVSLPDAVEATYQALSKGVSEKDLPEFLIKSAKAAKAGVTDLASAVELGSGVVNVFGGDVMKAFDNATTAVQGGALRFEDLNNVVGRIAPTFKAVGLSSEELFAALATLTSQNIKAEEGASGLKAALSNVIDTSKALTGEDGKLAKEQEKLNKQITALNKKYAELDIQKAKIIASDKTHGKSTSDVSAKLSELDAKYRILNQKRAELLANGSKINDGFTTEMLKAKGLTGLLEYLQKTTGGNVDQMKGLFSSVEAFNAMMALTSKEGGAKFKQMLSNQNNDLGNTNKAFEIIKKNDPTFALMNAANSVSVLRERIGRALLPELQRLSAWFVDGTKGLAKWVHDNKELAITLTKITAGVGGFLIVAGPLVSSITLITKAISLFTPATIAASAAVGTSGLAGAATTATGALGAGGLAGVLAAGGALVVGLALVVPLVWEMGKAYFNARDAAEGAKQAKLGEIDTLYKLELALNHAGVEYDAAKVRAMDTGEAIEYLTGKYNEHKLAISGTAQQVADAHKKMLEASMQRLQQEQRDIMSSETLWSNWGAEVGNAIRGVIDWIKNLLGWQQSAQGGGIPAFASGGYVTSPALHQTIFAGEEGPELATFPSGRRAILTAGMYNVPTGTYINTAAQTASRLNSSSRGGNVNVNINLSGNLRNNDDVARISRSIARQVRTSLVGAI